MAKDILDQQWDHVWRLTARQGMLDDVGSAEYRRYHRGWVADGRPAAFLREMYAALVRNLPEGTGHRPSPPPP